MFPSGVSILILIYGFSFHVVNKFTPENTLYEKYPGKIFIGIYFNAHNLDSTHTTYTYQLHIMAIKMAGSHRDTLTINQAPHYSEHVWY